ncbi:GNAT family N-acetyltransferase [Chlorogloeopsis sp. ULAP01]|uniref:GNAT family N-acetyltransferase n=1 Tax=Chlorogloeopsis sp. ULAP01 TaxID=3056483 RepID=UPI0025AAB15B|nr:GNAT family N-acetyltransferase [Chlorogloeopsis sp. ULAP01]MDM9384920.1 GNAT family N-acetyltransferase [Chlorogloeopsis sp. ULAP01]
MDQTKITYKESRDIDLHSILTLYKANHWSSADKPEQLYNALTNSHSLVSAWDKNKLVGLGNAISDGFLVVYYPHLLVLPEYHKRGIGRQIMTILMSRYQDFHQQILVADKEAIAFYKKCGFERSGKTEALWIYAGEEH